MASMAHRLAESRELLQGHGVVALPADRGPVVSAMPTAGPARIRDMFAEVLSADPMMWPRESRCDVGKSPGRDADGKVFQSASQAIL
ncbi:hypothetical protein AFM11_03240 [Mycolicibacterium wolinskyi]|uniref:Uncharacterized protein n=1 Tax=Mycolicibacterium wolinskyi TaxID=59750 RepID=A0A132PSJ3_9MYCO|nr:hypothetical protein AFM11_03240 [Mycolicibacterium wolinskyi]